MVINISDMSVRDKLLAMEQLWDSLCRQSPGELTPGWHGEVLQVREQRLLDGEERFIDLQHVKHDLNDLT